MKLNEQVKQKKKNLVAALIILTLALPFIMQGVKLWSTNGSHNVVSKNVEVGKYRIILRKIQNTYIQLRI